ncbi:MAG: hypothetical protein ACE5HE_02735 [Phycisphaerae bacterium]
MKTGTTRLLTVGLTMLALGGVFSALGTKDAQAIPFRKDLPACSQCPTVISNAFVVCELVACGDPCKYICEPKALDE